MTARSGGSALEQGSASRIRQFQSPAGSRLWFTPDDLALAQRSDALAIAFERRRIDPLAHLVDSRDSGLYGLGVEGPKAVAAANLPVLRISFIGSCLTQFTDSEIHAGGVKSGYDSLISHQWLTSAALDHLRDSDADFVVLQPGTQALLEPLFQQTTVTSAYRAAGRIGSLVAKMVERASDALRPNSELIVHNIGRPSHWPPVGSSHDWRAIWENLNRPIEDAVTKHDATLLDEMEMASRGGSQNLFDDTYFPWSHHGGATNIEIDAPNQLARVHTTYARELWGLINNRHRDSVKLIVADLDGTLWPGVLAERGPNEADDDSNTTWTHAGIQEVLKSFERQGVVLASLSKGDEEVTLALWEKSSYRLRPDDFALHSIDWTPKNERMRQILDVLQTTEERVIYIDDHPVERALMQRTFPSMTVLGEKIADVRAQLLESSPLRRGASGITGSRTASTKASVQREKDRALLSPEDFAEFIQVKKTARAATNGDLPRILELLDRTTQFTLGNSDSAESIERLVAHPGSVMVLEVADKYTNYGLVGVSVVERDTTPTLRAYSVSCRVLGLDAADYLLECHMEQLSTTQLRVALVETERNRVIREALAAWSLVQDSAGDFFINGKGSRNALDHTS